MKQFKKLIPFAVLASLTMSSCSDLLEKDSQDTITADQYFSNDANLLAFTYHLYGPYTWTNYESKFSWCANELSVGNVYHNYGDEGQFFFLSFDNTNAHLLNGYQCLYGVISRCNQIINELDAQCGPGVSLEAKNQAKGEAFLFRGMAYFLLTEYWGETYILNNNTNIIASDNAFNVPKASRACVYAQAEKDFTWAAQLLPDKVWGNFNERPSKAAAFGMLGKLYLTMGSAATPENDAFVQFKFTPSHSAAEYYQLSIANLNMALAYNSYLESTENYENLFWPKSYNPENIFNLYFENGDYGAGSCRQVNFSRSKYMDGGDDYYGGEKGLTVTLFNSFEKGDVRKKACCYYTEVDNDLPTTGKCDASNPTAGRDPIYKMYQDADYAYYYNPTKTFPDSPYGSEPESPCLNACRKFVYGVHLTNKFSAPLTMPFLRVADLYLMRAEATMALETGNANVFQKSSAGLADLNTIRRRAGLTDYTQPVALYDTDAPQLTTFTDDRDAENPVNYTYTTYSDKYDLFEERRHEFALECQNWLDLKRIYYRNAASAVEFLTNQDRGWTFGQRLGVTDFPKGKPQYQRQYEIHLADPKQPEEKPIEVANVKWFFPMPNTVATNGNNGPVWTDVASITNGTYPY